MAYKATPGSYTSPNNRLLQSPEQLLGFFQDYKKMCKKSPILKHDVKGKNNSDVYIQVERPLTYSGFLVFVAKAVKRVTLPDAYFNNDKGMYPEYIDTCRLIRQEIRDTQVVGGMAGIYNNNIVSRVAGLVDMQEVKQEVKKIKILSNNPLAKKRKKKS